MLITVLEINFVKIGTKLTNIIEFIRITKYIATSDNESQYLVSECRIKLLNNIKLKLVKTK